MKPAQWRAGELWARLGRLPGPHAVLPQAVCLSADCPLLLAKAPATTAGSPSTIARRGALCTASVAGYWILQGAFARTHAHGRHQTLMLHVLKLLLKLRCFPRCLAFCYQGSGSSALATLAS